MEEKTGKEKTNKSPEENQNKEEGAEKEKMAEQENKQLAIILIGMVVLILVGGLVYFIVYKSSNFTYMGLKFKKTKVGEIIFYSTQIPIRNFAGDIVRYYGMNLRSDPRDLRHIEIKNDIKFKKETVLSVSTDLESCKKKAVAVANFGRFLDFAGVEYTDVGTTDEFYAKEKNIQYITCENVTKNRTIIIIQNATLGTDTFIRKSVPDCYVIDVNNCEMLEALERIMVDVTSKALKNQ